MAHCNCDPDCRVEFVLVLSGRQAHAGHEVVAAELILIYLVDDYQSMYDTGELVTDWNCSHYSVCPSTSV
jgi:hypothetical protein